MRTLVSTVVLQTATGTATPGVGLAELVDYWPMLIRGAWFVVGFLVAAAVGWFLVVPAVSRAVTRRNRNNPTIQEAITEYTRVFVLVAAFFVGAGTAGYGQFLGDSALVIAAGTLAIGVAGQTVIGSLVSGLVLVADPEFNIGNYIEWDDGEGTIESITLRVTRVVTPNGKLVTVPNTTLTSRAITRPYGRGRYRVVEHLGIAYEADVEDAVALLEAAARSVDGVAADPRPRAYVDDFGSDSVVLRVHYWIENPRQRNTFGIRSAYAQAAKTRLDAADVTISPASKRELQGRIAVDEPA